MNQLTFGEPIATSGEESPPSLEGMPSKDQAYKGRPLSHSSITLYQACPQKWKFRYIDKVPEAPRPYFSFGKSVHHGLEFLFNRLGEGVPPLEDVLAVYKEKWIREGYESLTQEKWFFQEGERILKGFYAKHVAEFNRVFKVELKFDIVLDGIPVTGYVDRVDVTQKGGLAIVDYKTGRGFDRSRVEKDPQLTLYQIAVKMLFGKEVESLTLYHLNSLTPLTAGPHTEEMEFAYKAMVKKTAQGITDGLFDPKPDEQNCQWCDYLQICPAFSGRSSHRPAPLSNGKLMDVVDRYGKVTQTIQNLLAEKGQLERQLKDEFLRSGKKDLSGRCYKASLSMEDESTWTVEPLESAKTSA